MFQKDISNQNSQPTPTMLLISRCCCTTNQTFGGFALGKAFQFLLEFLEIPFSNHIFANASRIADVNNIGILEGTIQQGPKGYPRGGVSGQL
jgi:hypothetical protein